MADEEDRNQLIAQFSGVTDANAERAQFYLESSGWQLNVSCLCGDLFCLNRFFCPAKVQNDSNSFMLFIFDWSVFGVRFSHCSCTPLFLF